MTTLQHVWITAACVPTAAIFCLAAAPALAETPSAPPAAAKEAAALTGGGWLSLQSEGLRWLDAQGRTLGQLDLRGEQLDLRLQPDGSWIAAVLDSNTSQPVLLRGVPAAAGQAARLQTLPALPPLALNVETLCLHRDAQGLNHLFVIDGNGRVEQWLVQIGGHRLVRERALPQGAKSCRVDDARARLFISEEALGIWLYDIGTEGATKRQLIAQTAPWGALRGEIGPLALFPGGLALGNAAQVRVLHEGAQGWTLQNTRLPAAEGPVEALLATPALPALPGTAGHVQLHWLGEDGKAWRSQRVAAVKASVASPTLVVVPPQAQTEPMATLGDAADDPAIWVHPSKPESSRVLGTNKKQGLAVYDLSGKQLQFLASGRVNNVDVRQGVRIGGQVMDVAVASHRDLPGLAVYTIGADGSVTDAARVELPLDDIYGLCIARTPDNELDVYANDEDGTFLHLRLNLRLNSRPDQAGGTWQARELRRFKVGSQPEGCVVDEAAERVFIGEEDVAVWALSSRADQPPVLEPVLKVGGLVRDDIEGLGLYRTAEAAYLVVSSQGNDSYVVLDAAPPYRVRGSFRIGINATLGIDGASETDGLEVTSSPLGPKYPRGMLVVQDGHKTLPTGAQNFKLVSWQDIEAALGLR